MNENKWDLNNEISDIEEHNSEENESLIDTEKNHNSFSIELDEELKDVNDIFEDILDDKNKNNNLLLDRLLKNDDFYKYEGNIKENFKLRNQKRNEVNGEEEDMK